jgi:hypothetical protein
MNKFNKSFAALACCLFLTACDRPAPNEVKTAEPPVGTGSESQPVETFLAAIVQHCGKAYGGRIIANEPPVESDPFDGKALVMHVRECGDAGLKIPFHVGDDHSRTWVLTRNGASLQLKHDHRHEDGSEDAVTQYGGTSASAGSALRQEFPVDAYSIGMFEREGLTASVTNVWALEIETGKRFMYELARPGGRLFRVEFDLTSPVPAPPAPWGHD